MRPDIKQLAERNTILWIAIVNQSQAVRHQTKELTKKLYRCNVNKEYDPGWKYRYYFRVVHTWWMLFIEVDGALFSNPPQEFDSLVFEVNIINKFHTGIHQPPRNSLIEPESDPKLTAKLRPVATCSNSCHFRTPMQNIK